MNIPQIKKIHDISIPLYEGMITYPNNTPFSITERTTASGSLLAEIILGSHTGTHTDSPRHQGCGDINVDDYDLSHYMGDAVVVDCTHRGPGEVVEVADVEGKDLQGKRVLLKTSNSLRGFEDFYDDFVALGGDTATYLRDQGVALVGIDALSVKKRGGSDNRAHTELLEKKIPIIEGLNLQNVSEGDYFLSSAPLSMRDTEGAPLRALLLEF